MSADPRSAALEAARQRIDGLVRAIHHYGNPPDSRLARRVDADVEEIVEACEAYAAALAPEPSPEMVERIARLTLDVAYDETHDLVVARVVARLSPPARAPQERE